MAESWKKWPGSTMWIHGKPVADPADERNDKYYKEKDAKAKGEKSSKSSKKKTLLRARGGGGTMDNLMTSNPKSKIVNRLRLKR